MNFGEFVGGSIEGTIGVFVIVILTVAFFAIVVKILETLANKATRVSGLDPKSKLGETRSTRIGLTLFALFMIFGLFIAPLLGD
jgi:Mn2+/Fe2+ NRAMP family transporter